MKGYEGLYKVSNHGRLKHLGFYVSIKNQVGETNKKAYHPERIQKPSVDRYGYLRYVLCKAENKEYKRKYILAHRLVAETFIPDKTTFKSTPDENRDEINLDDLQINHKDECKKNNCVDNLEWCTVQYNATYGTKIKRSSLNGRTKVVQLTKNYEILKIWDSLTIASEALHISAGRICLCCKGKAKSAGGYSWKYYEEVKDEQTMVL